MKARRYPVGDVDAGGRCAFKILRIKDHEIGGFIGQIDHISHQPTITFWCIFAARHEYKLARVAQWPEIMDLPRACIQIIFEKPRVGTMLKQVVLGQCCRKSIAIALPKDHLFQHGADTRLFKYDLDAGTRQVHDFGPQRHPGELVFVPRSENAPEGDGWLMGYVINLADETTDFVILDAQNFERTPAASVHIPHRIPPGFHGNWVTS